MSAEGNPPSGVGDARDAAFMSGIVAWGIDVGGTWTRVGGIDDGEAIVVARRVLTFAEGGVGPDGDEFVAHLAQHVRELTGAPWSSDHSAGARVGDPPPVAAPVGVALAGIVDRSAGRLIRSVNLPFLEGFPVVDALGESLHGPVALCSDAEAAAWAEYQACRERPDRFVHLRIGTGIACGLVLDGELQDIVQGRTTHWPLLIVDPSVTAPVCPCGLHGCLEVVASGRALREQALRSSDSMSLMSLNTACEKGDPAAARIVQRAAEGLSIALRRIVEEFAPSVVVLGGGVVEQLPCLVREARRLTGDAGARIELARAGDDAGWLGAAGMALQAQGMTDRSRGPGPSRSG